MTREDALDSGIRQAWRFVGDVADDVTPEEAARAAVEFCWPDGCSEHEAEGFAVGLTMIAVEVAEMARKKRAAAQGLDTENESDTAEALCDGSGASLDYGGPFDCPGCQACEP